MTSGTSAEYFSTYELKIFLHINMNNTNTIFDLRGNRIWELTFHYNTVIKGLVDCLLWGRLKKSPEMSWSHLITELPNPIINMTERVSEMGWDETSYAHSGTPTCDFYIFKPLKYNWLCVIGFNRRLLSSMGKALHQLRIASKRALLQWLSWTFSFIWKQICTRA